MHQKLYEHRSELSIQSLVAGMPRAFNKRVLMTHRNCWIVSMVMFRLPLCSGDSWRKILCLGSLALAMI
jgi:hypothetical protein